MTRRLLTINLMGNLRILHDDVPVSGFVSVKAQALFVYLALHPGPQQRSFLVHLLWSESAERDGKTSLRSVLSNLKKVVGDYVDITRQAVAFRHDQPVQIDVEQLDSAVTSDALLNLMNGTFLEGFVVKDASRFEAWLTQKREEIRLACVAQLGEFLDQTADVQLKERLLNQLLIFDSWREENWLTKIRLLALNGREAEALRTAQAFRTRCEQEKLPVSARFDQLCQRVEQRQMRQSLHNIPAAPTPFVGRGSELDRIQQAFTQQNSRLVTLAGLGGIGKTRLGQAFGRQAVHLFMDGAMWVPLAAADTADDLLSSLAVATQQPASPQFGTEAGLVSWLAGKELLLILDNFEQLAGESPLIGRLLDQLPELHFLVTSREILNLYDETVLDIAGLSYPQSDEWGGESYGALSLFSHVAQRSTADFNLRAQKKEVATICQLLSGVPLALELAAATLRQRTISDLTETIQEEFLQLETRFRNVPERHRSLRAVFDYSWALLTEKEQDLLVRTAVFIGGYTAEAALEIGNGDLRTLQALVDQSLVRFDAAQNRYTQHQMIRHFAAERLQERGLLTATRDAHLAYFVRVLGGAYVAGRYALSKEIIDQSTSDADNLIQARAYALEARDFAALEILARLTHHFFDLKSMFRRESRFFEYAADLLKDEKSREGRLAYTRCYFFYGFFLERSSQYELALMVLKECAKIYKHELTDQTQYLMAVLCHVGLLLFQMDKNEEAKRYLNEAIVLGRDEPSSATWALVYSRLGMIASIQGEYQRALGYIQTSIDHYEVLQNRRGAAVARYELGQLYRQLGRYDESLKVYTDALAYLEEIGERFGKIMTLHRLGDVARETGRFDEARDYLNQGLVMAEEVNRPQAIGMFTLSLGMVEAAVDDDETAEKWLLQLIGSADEHQFPRMGAVATAVLGHLYLTQGDGERAAGLFKRSLTWLVQLETPPLNLLVFSFMTDWLMINGYSPLVHQIVRLIETHSGASAWIRARGDEQRGRFGLGDRETDQPAEYASVEEMTAQLQAVFDPVAD